MTEFKSGKRIGGEHETEAEHFFTCSICGQAVDRRDLVEVFYHEKPGHRARVRD